MGVVFYTLVQDVWYMLPGMFVEANTMVVLKKLLDGTLRCRQWRDVDHMQAGGISLIWHLL